VVGVATALAAGSAPVLCGALPARGGCYDARVAPGSSVCREALGGACVRHAEEVTGGPKKSVRVREAPAGCTVGGTNTDNCQTCNVQIGDSLYCSQCKTGFVPINGKCVAFSDSSVTTTAECAKSDGNLDQSSTTCGKCTGTNYFLHKGGCYAQATPPGSAICKAAGAAGICEVCQAGYFKNPASTSDATKQSCIACGDTTGADSNLGVANCAECTAPATSGSGGTAKCTKCTDPNHLMTATDESTSCVTECPTGYFGHTATSGGLKTCQSCSGENAGLTPAGAGVDGCAACTYASNKVTCTKCEAGKYLKTTSDSTSCVEASGCGPSAFLKDDAETENKYMPCGEAGSGGIADCAKCSLFSYK
ncbi:Guanylate kinase, partial [Giardia duodenalis]